METLDYLERERERERVAEKSEREREREWEHLIDDVWYFEAELTGHWFRDCRNHDWNGTDYGTNCD